MKQHKRWSITVLSLVILLMGVLMGINFAVDPLQYYRKADYPPSFSTQQRYQNPGLARNYDYDTIIIGTSMTENFLPSSVDKKLGGKTLKLSMSGATAKEQYMIAKMAIDTGKVKHVIWGVDYFALRGEPDRVRDEYGPFPFYFYDKNPLNEWRYLLNVDTTVDSLKIVGSRMGLYEQPRQDLNLLNTWTNYSFSKELVMKEWDKVKQSQPVTSSEYEFANIQHNLDHNLISLIKAHPEIQFTLFYPPYSILQHRFFYEKGKVLFDNELAAKTYLYEQVGSLQQVRIFDFQQESTITFNLNNYKDLAHHSMEINEYMIDCMAAERYLVTADNLHTFGEELRKQVETLQPEKL
ncbi:MAG TPA: hypothetical protein VE710_06170 [Candidatus Bathyarchaeia archaeon]|nr:hypothetical protein [Candidatus Bathyarchaeia archaeon]